MQIPVRNSYCNFEHSDANEKPVRKKVAKRTTYHDRITNCGDIIEGLRWQHYNGKLYNDRVNLMLLARRSW